MVPRPGGRSASARCRGPVRDRTRKALDASGTASCSHSGGGSAGSLLSDSARCTSATMPTEETDCPAPVTRQVGSAEPTRPRTTTHAGRSLVDSDIAAKSSGSLSKKSWETKMASPASFDAASRASARVSSDRTSTPLAPEVWTTMA
eukprot:3685416-Prymnesium_polylepis.1